MEKWKKWEILKLCGRVQLTNNKNEGRVKLSVISWKCWTCVLKHKWHSRFSFSFHGDNLNSASDLNSFIAVYFIFITDYFMRPHPQTLWKALSPLLFRYYWIRCLPPPSCRPRQTHRAFLLRPFHPSSSSPPGSSRCNTGDWGEDNQNKLRISHIKCVDYGRKKEKSCRNYEDSRASSLLSGIIAWLERTLGVQTMITAEHKYVTRI